MLYQQKEMIFLMARDFANIDCAKTCLIFGLLLIFLIADELFSLFSLVFQFYGANPFRVDEYVCSFIFMKVVC